MKELIERTNSDKGILIMENDHETNSCSEEELADVIMDAFNEQLIQNILFKQKIESMMDSMDFTYPNHRAKLKETMALFFESLNDFSKENMKKMFDLHLIFKPNETSKMQHGHFPTTVPILENNQWAQDWMEQIHYLKGNSDILPRMDCDMENFCFYIDLTDGNSTDK